MNIIYEFYHGHSIDVLDLGSVILVRESVNDSMMRVTENKEYLKDIRWAVENTDRHIDEEAFYHAMSADAAYRLEDAINKLESLMENDAIDKARLIKEKDEIFTRFRRRKRLESREADDAELALIESTLQRIRKTRLRGLE